ncbi:MAG: MEDS domain-containing protein, partial [Limisphaerales bacterium]
MPWGTHFCHFYETKQDLLEILVPYFRAGLEHNEFCLWVIAAPLTGVEAARALQRAVPDLEQHLADRRMEIQVIGKTAGKALRQAIPNLEHNLDRRSVEIIPHDQWYLKGGDFDSLRVLKSWKAKLKEALARGYAGMRVHGNEAWLR